MGSEKREGILNRRVLARGAQVYLIEEFEQSLAMTGIEAPQKRIVIVIGIRHMGETIGNHGVALVSHHRRHVSQTVFGRGLLLHRGEEVRENRGWFVGDAVGS